MNVKSAFDLLGFFSMPPSEEGVKAHPTLKSDEKALYDKIVKDLLRFYAERLEHPNPSLDSSLSGQECALIFRQSKSWLEVEKLFKTIVDLSPVDKKIKLWAGNWIKRISTMRGLQNKIHTSAQSIQENTKKLKNVSNNSPLKEKLSQEILKSKKSVAIARKLIVEELAKGRKDLETLDSKILKDSSCQKVVKFITDNWLHLRVFCDWPEVSLDETKLTVQVQRCKDSPPKEDIPFNDLVNSSTKAIFLIKQSGHEESPLEYEGIEPGKIIRTTKIELKDKHFAPESPSPRKRSSSMSISDAYIFNTDFAQAQEDEEDIRKKVKTTGATARKLERVVKLALKEVNSKLTESTDVDEAAQDDPQAGMGESSNPIWLIIRFPIQQLFGGASKEMPEKREKECHEND